MLIWTLTKGDVGAANQALGLAERIADILDEAREDPCKIVAKTANRKGLLAALPMSLPTTSLWGLSADSDPLAPPWPDILVSCGRRAAALAINIRKRSLGGTITVHLQDPLRNPKHFDLLAIPDHDRVNRDLKRDNVMYTMGAPNRITAARLETGAAALASRLENDGKQVSEPRVAVLFGGPNKRYSMPPPLVQTMVGQIKAMRDAEGAGLLVTTSRRTGDANAATVRGTLDGPGTWIWNGEGENPYFGMLGLADHIVVTADSISMVSEACATGKPVYVIPLDGKSKRFDSFHRSMQAGGFTRPFEGRLETWEYIPLDETGRIAREAVKLLAGRRKNS